MLFFIQLKCSLNYLQLSFLSPSNHMHNSEICIRLPQLESLPHMVNGAYTFLCQEAKEQLSTCWYGDCWLFRLQLGAAWWYPFGCRHTNCECDGRCQECSYSLPGKLLKQCGWDVFGTMAWGHHSWSCFKLLKNPTIFHGNFTHALSGNSHFETYNMDGVYWLTWENKNFSTILQKCKDS